MHLTPNQMYFNSQWEGNPNRIPTPTIPNQSEISDIPPKSDTPQDFVNVQPRRKIRPSADEKPDFSTPIGPPLPDWNKTFPLIQYLELEHSFLIFVLLVLIVLLQESLNLLRLQRYQHH